MSHKKVFFTTATKLSGDREFLKFNDRHVEIEDPLINFEEDSTRQHVYLNYDQAIDLRDFLNEKLAS